MDAEWNLNTVARLRNPAPCLEKWRDVLRRAAVLALLLISCAPAAKPSDDAAAADAERPDAPALEPAEAYRPLDLDAYASRLREGADPVLLVRELFGNQEIRGGEEVRIVEETRTSMTVIVTVLNLMDDSVRDRRVRATLKRSSESERWRVLRAGEQFRCQPGRGQREWSGELCS